MTEREVWTLAEVQELRRLHDQGFNKKEAAAAMGRSYYSVAEKVRQLNLSFEGQRGSGKRDKPPAQGEEWTTEEDALILKALAEGKGYQEIGGLVPARTEWAVRSRITKLRGNAASAAPAPPWWNRPYSAREDEIIIAGRAAGLTVQDITARLPGRTFRGVESRIKKLGDEAALGKQSNRFDAQRPMAEAGPPRKTCQYILDADVLSALDESEDLHYCGKPSEPGYSFCAEHKARCYVPTTQEQHESWQQQWQQQTQDGSS